MDPRTRSDRRVPRIRDRIRVAAVALAVLAATSALAEKGPPPTGPVLSIPSLRDFATTVARLEAAIEEVGLGARAWAEHRGRSRVRLWRLGAAFASVPASARARSRRPCGVP